MTERERLGQRLERERHTNSSREREDREKRRATEQVQAFFRSKLAAWEQNSSQRKQSGSSGEEGG